MAGVMIVTGAGRGICAAVARLGAAHGYRVCVNYGRSEASAEAPPGKAGIGLHFGPVVLGDIVDERRLEFAVSGDTVNVASRLEAMTRKLGVAVIASNDIVAKA